MSSAIRDIFRPRRYPMDERLPDGTSVDELVAAQGVRPAPNPQVLTPNNQAAITRRRRVMDSVRQAVSQQPLQEDLLGKAPSSGQRVVPSDMAQGEPDVIDQEAARLRELEAKPVGFWKRFGAGLLSRAITRRGEEPIPITARQREIQRLKRSLGRDIELKKQEMNDLVPVTLNDGSIVTVPRRTAGGLQSRQQEVGMRKAKQDAQVERWNGMTARDRRRDIAGLYKSGALNTKEGLEYAARELDIPTAMMPAFIAGQMRDAIDEQGNYVQINRQSGVPTQTGVGSYEVTKEAGRNRRFNENQDRLNKPKPVTPSKPPAPDKTANRRAAALIAEIEDARSEMEDADRQGLETKRRTAQRRGEKAAIELNALGAGYEAGRGEKGYPYYKQTGGAQQQAPSGNYQGRRISKANLPEVGRRLGMTPEQAGEYLKSQGAVIY